MKECFNSQRDGILLWDKARFRRMKKFQFPTGWNSTRLTKAAVKRDRFQFPTGWNSTLVACFSLRPLSVVSIPNGMEFYRKFTYALPFSIEFQFPTGWNSTRLCWQRNRTRRVSIPNGMEFYLILKWMKDLDQQVSIPNGMEFYLNPCLSRRRTTSFNSQRDGILLFLVHQLNRPIKIVSIPNGMEFYVIFKFAQKLELIAFQFPTGWNSTIITTQKYITANSFNSQRDGILQFQSKSPI